MELHREYHNVIRLITMPKKRKKNLLWLYKVSSKNLVKILPNLHRLTYFLQLLELSSIFIFKKFILLYQIIYISS